MPPNRMHLVRAAALLALVAAGPLACRPSTPDTTTPDAGQTPPPDAGQPPPDAGPTPVIDPSWSGVSLQRGWLREGFGEGQVLALTDLEGDGNHEVIYGGRGVSLLDPAALFEGHAPRWSMDWNQDDADIQTGGDNPLTQSLTQLSLNEDDVQDLLVLTEMGEAYGVDGKTGQKLWYRKLELDHGISELVALPRDGAGIFFPSGGRSAFALKDGARVWTAAELENTPLFVTKGDVDADGAEDIITASQEPQCGGHSCPPPTEPVPAYLHAFGFDGSLLFSHTVDGPVSSVAAADLDGVVDGVNALPLSDELLVGTHDSMTYESKLVALNAQGILWERSLGAGFVERIMSADHDSDHRAELYVVLNPRDPGFPPRLLALDSEGNLRFEQKLDSAVAASMFMDVNEDGAPDLLLALGSPWEGVGGMLALDVRAMDVEPAAGGRVLWHNAYPVPTRSFQPATVNGESVLLLGSEDTWLRALDPRTGEERWSYYGGGYVQSLATGDMDGDGLDEAVSGESRGYLMLAHPADGRRGWTRRMDVGLHGDIFEMTMGDLTGDGRAEVVAVATTFPPVDGYSVIEAYDAEGTRVLSQPLSTLVGEVVVADVNGDGTNEVVLAELDPLLGMCGVRVMGLQGQTLWSQVASPSCATPTLAVGDADGDGAMEIAYAEMTRDTVPVAALFEADGTLAWSVDLGVEAAISAAWVRVVPGGLVYGGVGPEAEGRVNKLSAADGSLVWRRAFVPIVDPVYDGDTIGMYVHEGVLVDDRHNDGVDELAIANISGQVHLLDGATGELMWSRRINVLELPDNQRHDAGPLAYVPATATRPPYLVVGQTRFGRARSSLFALKLDGEIAASFPMPDRTFALGVARLAPGAQPGVLAASGLGVHAFEAVEQ